jgi:DNA-binding response OmpR family regulator
MTQIFLLEDDPIVGKAIQLQLELESFKVHWAQSIQEARRVFSDHPSVDLFLLDVNLPITPAFTDNQFSGRVFNNYGVRI